MRSQVLVELVKLMSEDDYTFTLSDITYVKKLFSSKKQAVLLLTQREYECLKRLLDNANDSTLKAESKKKYSAWFSQQCFVHDLITFYFYQQCKNKSILKDVFFDLTDYHYASDYQFQFTDNKISFLMNDCRKEIDAGAFLCQYNESAKNSGLISKVVLTDLFQLVNPAEIACFKETISTSAEKADLVHATWHLRSNQKNVSAALVFNKNEQAFFIQKNNTHIELKPSHFLTDFKKQYRKERPWYGNIAEWLGFGTLGKLNKKSSDVDKIEFLINHAKENSDGTTANTLESLFHATDFVNDFKKQYRKERPWYGFLTEKIGAGTLGKLNEKKKNAAEFLNDYGKIKSDSTTAKTLNSLKQFSVYNAVVEDKPVAEEVKRIDAATARSQQSDFSDRQTPISSDRLSVEAMIKMRDFSRERANLEMKEQEARESLTSGLLVEFEKGLECIVRQEKIKRVQKQKLIARENLLKNLESSLKLFWLSVDRDEKNINVAQKKYIVVQDVGVTKIQCHLFFNEKEIASLAAYAASEESIKTYRWVQSVRVLYEKFGMVRDSLGNLFLSDEEINNSVNKFMRTVNQLAKAEYLDKNVFKNLSGSYASYEISVENMKTASAAPAMRL